MNKQLDLWYPFIISRNKSSDYAVIVAPGFLLLHKQLSALIQATQYEKDTQSGTIVHCQVKDQEDGQKDFTLIFRVDIATKQDIGENGLDQLRDESYTPIKLIQGIVCKGLIPQEDIKISDKYFQEVRKYVKQQYQNFWNNPTKGVFSSQPLPNQDTSSPFFTVKSIQTYNVPKPNSEIFVIPPSKPIKPVKSHRDNSSVILYSIVIALLSSAALYIAANHFFFLG